MLQIPTLSTCPRYWRSEGRRHGNFKFPAGADRSGGVTMQALRHQFIPDLFQSHTMPNGLDRGGWGATKIVTASNLKDCEITKCVTGRKQLEKICISLINVIKAGKVLSGWKFNLKLNRDKVGNEDLATFPSCYTQLSNVKYIKFKIYKHQT